MTSSSSPSAETPERMTHLIDWLSDGWTHCQHGTKEWCEAYLHNARDVLAALPAPQIKAGETDELDLSQLAFDQQSDDPQPGDWNDACRHIAELLRNPPPSTSETVLEPRAALSSKPGETIGGEALAPLPREPTEAMIEAGYRAFGDDLTDDTPAAVYRAMVAATQPTAADDHLCPICAKPFEPADLCATDIELGTCHAACLEGAPTVDLETGDPVDGPIPTYRYDDGAAAMRLLKQIAAKVRATP